MAAQNTISKNIISRCALSGAVSAAALACLAGSAIGDDAIQMFVGDRADALAAVQSDFPGVRVHREAGRVSMIYGKPMTADVAPALAAERWLEDYAASFGQEGLELTLERAHDVSGGKFTIFDYRQTIAGVPVEFGMVKVLVLNGRDSTELDQVVFASANVAYDLAERETLNFNVDLEAGEAVDSVRNRFVFRHYTHWEQPELAIWFGDGEWAEPRVVYKFYGADTSGISADNHTFFVDANTGELLKARSETYFADQPGQVRGLGSPGDLPDINSNPPVLLPMGNITVTSSAGGSSVTLDDGTFNIPGPTGTNTVSAALASASPIFRIINVDSGGVLTASDSASPTDPADIRFNTNPSENLTAQVNAAVHTAITHAYITDRSSFTGLDLLMPINVNITSASGINGCNAFFSGGNLSTNYFRELNGCANTAFSTVVAHEYGHFIVNRLGLAQGGFGEGYGDVVAMLIYDTNVVGRNFRLSGGPVRTPQAANQQFPCTSSSVHTCGQILGGTWYDLRDAFVAQDGLNTGLENVRQLQVSWSVVTNGGVGTNSLNSAHPGTAIEVLTLDDNDGNLDNGTPNFGLICDAFSNRNIDCPDIQPVFIEYPSGRPGFVNPDVATTFPVTITANGATPDTNGIVLFASVDGAAPQVTPLVNVGGDNFEATLPAADCFSSIDWYVQVGTTDSSPVFSPSDALAGGRFGSSVATGTTTTFADDFQTDTGWAVGGSVSDGQWTRGTPVNCGRGDPASDFDGSGQAYLTDNSSGNNCNSDVDGGETILTSPVFDASSGATVVSYATWLDNSFGAAPGEDPLIVEISGNGGSTWTTLEIVGPAGDQASGGWFQKEFRVDDFIAPTSTAQLRFRVGDDPNSGSVVEAGVDAFQVSQLDCDTVDCPADLSSPANPGVPDGVLTGADFFEFLNLFQAGDLAIDFSSPTNPGTPDGVLTGADFFEFLNLFSAGC